ncbi:MAG TPA: glycosyltransferase family 39 protein [Thermoleophilaceae bacterium]|nr:glycosyltransferase family 39 protein [Thermoleophilaceae bacterium]
MAAPVSRRFAVALGAIVAAGVAVRVAHTLLVAPWPPGFFNDEAYYKAVAELVARGAGFVRPGEYFGQGISIPTAERPPLYSLALAGLVKLHLGGPDGMRLLGAVSGGAVIALLGLLGRRLAGDRAGLIAAGLAAAYPTLIAADGALMTESLYGMFAAAALLLMQGQLREPNVRLAALLGAVAGLAALTRGEGLILLPILLLPLLRTGPGRRAVLAALVAFAIVLTPWTIRNWSAFDRPVLVATESGQTIAGANCEAAYHGRNLGSWQVSCVRLTGDRNEAVDNNQAGRKGIEYARDHVERVPLVAAARVTRTWGLFWPGQVPEGRAKWVTYAGVAVYVLLLPLAVFGLVTLRRRRVPIWAMATPLVVVTVASLLTYGSVRFRHTAELVLVVLAAVAIDALLRRRAEPEVRPA